MTPQEALNILNSLAAMAPVPRQLHAQAIQAHSVLAAALSGEQSPANPQ